jgi:protein ImuA
MVLAGKTDIISDLKMDILRLQGFADGKAGGRYGGPKVLTDVFPDSSFPLGAVHEFISTGIESTAATSGFISGLMGSLMGSRGTILWISSFRTIFPAALIEFGIQPERCVFVDLKKEKDVLWAMNESLKCDALTAVVGEIRDLDFNASRRLQLAVEQSKVTGFVIRQKPRQLNATACVSRWKITHLPSVPMDDLPGIGFQQWKAELLKIRNGKPGVWNVQWTKGDSLMSAMKIVQHVAATEIKHQQVKAG